MPPFESDLKRSSVKPSSTKNQIPVSEAGTSVAPRQRPKGSAQPSHNLPLVAPPSPSPRNTLSSPIPQTAEVAGIKTEPFAAQFQANFPPIATQIPVTIPQQPAPIPLQQSQAPAPLPPTQQQSVPILPQQQEQAIAAATTVTTVANINSQIEENLFESNFAHPFRGSGNNLVASTGSFTQIDAGVITHLPQDMVMPLETVGTPTKTVQLLGAPKTNSGHRRNMSDTSAFNK